MPKITSRPYSPKLTPKSYRPKRGFASMKDRDRQREIARLGGIAVSRDSAHMAAIGAIGGARGKRGPAVRSR